MIGLFLFILSIVLLLIIEVISYFYYLITHRNAKGYWLSAAKDVDKFGNRHFRTLFNGVLIKKDGYKFGNIEETISEVLGYNIQTKTLTKLGKVVVFILTEKHCLDSIKP